MFQDVSYALIFGKPLVLYLGIFTLLAFLFTATIAVLNRKGIHTIPFLWHPRCAAVAICIALVHGALVVLAYW
ncbi:MAG: hypothetical protein Q7J03_05935 [Methanoregula sp.]|nr:hypothetical protein [Methanoregula sp.]